ncbi:hypothetical protein GYMLUDRAFT_153666 [Collybiopsis luxurians FD-317 M1]|nr:hypothetical protein GYMLUDRAFT_153666 [Collybiopsis luxurians FD-317 M1]
MVSRDNQPVEAKVCTPESSTPFPLTPETSANKSAEDTVPCQRRSWSKFTKTYSPQLILENCGSVARDHLACERTYLAYVRTSLALSSMGVALVQLLTISVDANSHESSVFKQTSGSMQSYAKPLGSSMVVFSIVVLIIGIMRYFTIQHALTVNQFPVARILILATSTILVVLVVIIFAILVTFT